ncbi:enolase C-terminal domain-like protein [Puia sp. P3]|uniref:enolase C-terminal domain-like protein n=1 Tax=Puia sp. P3 TaxID=3423952 RepID=UPI003D671F08
MGDLGVQFCEQPMRTYNDPHLPELRSSVPVKIMADESVFHHYDALRLITDRACDYVNASNLQNPAASSRLPASTPSANSAASPV